MDLLIPIFEDDVLKIFARQSQSDQQSNSVLLSFTGIGHGMGGLAVQKPEFFGTGRTFDNIIFITDKKRSWGNNLDFEFIRDTVAPLAGSRKIYSIGNSMGGFNAVISSNYLTTHTCLAFVPQFSVDPTIVPWEQRWKEYTSKITEFRYQSLENYMNDTTNYFIFTGNKGRDHLHAKLFPKKNNVHHYSFEGMGHNVAQKLKEHDALDVAVRCSINGEHALPIDIEYSKLSPIPA